MSENTGVEETIAEARQLAEGATTMDTFDFAAYVESKTKLPTFDVVVCLDAEAATAWNDLKATISQIRTDKELLRQNAAPSSPKAVRSIADIDENAEKQAAYEYQIQSAEAEMERLSATVKESSLTFTLRGLFPEDTNDIRRTTEKSTGFDPTRAPTPPDPGSNLTDAQFQAATEAHAAAEKEYNDLAEKSSNELISRLLVAACVKVVNGKGQVHNAEFTMENLAFLRKRLILSEWGKLVQATNKASFIGSVFDTLVDAGFPGGSPDVAG